MSVGRFFAILLLALAGLIGLGMSLCGGLLLVLSPGGGALVVTAIGVLIAYGAWRGLRGSPKPPSPPPGDESAPKDS